jgi:hypothetical protein
MSRWTFSQGSLTIHAIGWDPGLASFFLQLNAQYDEPRLWLGTQYGEYPEPEPLVERLRQAYDDDDPELAFIPLDLADQLRADREADPEWRPAADRVDEGSLKLTIVEAGKQPRRMPTFRSAWAQLVGGK